MSAPAETRLATACRRITDEAELLALVKAHRSNPLELATIARFARREALGYDAVARLVSNTQSSAAALLCNPELRYRPLELVAALTSLTIEPDDGGAILPLVYALHPLVYTILEDYTRDQVEKREDNGHDLALLLLTAGPVLQAMTLDAIIASYYTSHELMYALVRHPSTGPSHWDRIGSSPPYENSAYEARVLQALCMTPARSVPSVRARIIVSKAPSPLLTIAQDATPAELRRLIPSLAEYAPKQTLTMLEKGAIQQAHHLTHVDWVSFLQHSDPSIRERALLTLPLSRNPKDR